MNAVNVSFLKLDSRAIPPTRMNDSDAGFDLHAIERVTLHPGERTAVGTGLALAIPAGYAGLVLPRSGHALRHGLSLVNSPGLIDPGYRGEVRVILINHGKDVVSFEGGDRIAQLVVTPIPATAYLEVEELPASDRGTGGFGSTGA